MFILNKISDFSIRLIGTGDISMQRNLKHYSTPRNSITFLLSLSLLSGFSPVVAQQNPPQNSVIQSQQTREFNRTVTLFNILLGVLVLLLVIAIATLFATRRKVIKQLAEVVKTNFHELDALEKKLAEANKLVESTIVSVQDTADELNIDADELHQEITAQKEHLSKHLAELTRSKQQLLTNLETQINRAKHTLEESETNFAELLQELQNDAQKQHFLILKDLTQLKAELPQELTILQQRKDEVVESLKQSESKFIKALNQLQVKTEERQQSIIQNLEKIGADFPTQLETDLQGKKDEILQNIQQLEAEFAEKLKKLKFSKIFNN